MHWYKFSQNNPYTSCRRSHGTVPLDSFNILYVLQVSQVVLASYSLLVCIITNLICLVEVLRLTVSTYHISVMVNGNIPEVLGSFQIKGSRPSFFFLCQCIIVFFILCQNRVSLHCASKLRNISIGMFNPFNRVFVCCKAV